MHVEFQVSILGVVTGFLVALQDFFIFQGKSFYSALGSPKSGDYAASLCKQGQLCPQSSVYEFTCPVRSNLSTRELQTSVEVFTQMAGYPLNMLICEYLIL